MSTVIENTTDVRDLNHTVIRNSGSAELQNDAVEPIRAYLLNHDIGEGADVVMREVRLQNAENASILSGLVLLRDLTSNNCNRET